jgi:hypothetical protein
MKYSQYRCISVEMDKVYVIYGGKIRIKNEKVKQLALDRDDGICDRLRDITNEIYNVGSQAYPVCRIKDISKVSIKSGRYAIDDHEKKFTANNLHPRNGFIIDLYDKPFHDRNVKIYATREYKRELLIHAEFRPNTRIKCGPNYMVPIRNSNLYNLIILILLNIKENIIEKLEALVDIYCDIVYLVNQVNTIPSSAKSARAIN